MYPDQDLGTIKGFAAELDGELLGVCGVMYATPMQAFSTIKEELQQWPKVIIKASKMLADILNECDATVIAVADERWPNSQRFLERVGFEHVEDRTYVWPIQ